MPKIYVITGATSGIGNAVIRKLSANNKIFAGYRNEDKIQQITDINNENIYPFYIDMNDCDSIESAAKYICDSTDHIDTIINAAGSVVAGAVEDLNIDKIKQQFQVNTFSHLDFTKRLLPLLDNSKIINISSMSSYGIFPFISPYCASKRALDILFNSLQIEYGNKIKIISIKPGAVATPIWTKAINENEKLLTKHSKYKNEYNFLINNAKNNQKRSLNIEKVVDVILMADRAKFPKSSYKVGYDAYFSSFLSIMPQDIIHKVVKLGLKLRLGNV